MPIIVLSNVYRGRPLEILKECVPDGFDLRILHELSEDALTECAHDADYILASGRLGISEKVIENAPSLKMVQRTGVGLDSIDRIALKKRNIPLYVNQGVNAQSVAEHTILLILACLRQLCTVNANTKNGIWNKQAQGVTTYELCGKTVGMIGMGNIGRNAASVLKAFGAEILYYDMFRRSSEEEKSLGLRYVPLEELLKLSDIISLHCPLTDDTRKMICRETISLMKDGVILVNTARGGLIDEAALYEAIKSGKVGFAGLDVHAEEPIKDINGLISSDKVIATPHIGGVTYDSFHRMMSEAMKNISLFHQGKTDEIEPFRLELNN